MPKPQKHVLVLMCDQMRADRLGVVDPAAHTPNLDELCAKGVHCSKAFSNHPQCSPARACIVTGQYSHEAGVIALKNFANQRSTLTAHHPSLGKVFHENDYRTVYFGKGHFEIPLADLGFHEGHCTDGVKVSDAEAEERGFPYAHPVLRSDYLSHQEACAWLENYDDDGRPLFFYFSTNLPHPPFFTHPDYIDLFPPDSLQLPASHGKETFTNKPDFLKQHASSDHGSHDSDQQRKELAQYYSMIASMDSHFGDIINLFKQRGMWDDTIVLVIADHGDMMGGHNLRLKGCMPYDDILQIPMIWRFPQDEHAQTTCNALLDQVHVPVTLMQAAGLSVPDSFKHGGQLDKIIAAQATPEKDERIFFEHYAAYWGKHPFLGVRTQEWKYLRYYGPDENFEELYHLSADPHELVNVAHDPQHANIKQGLRAEVDTWWQETDGKDNAFYESAHFAEGHWNQERYRSNSLAGKI